MIGLVKVKNIKTKGLRFIKSMVMVLISLMFVIMYNPIESNAATIELKFSLDKTNPKPGDTVYLDVKFKSSSKVLGLDLYVEYNSNILDFENDNAEVFLESAGRIHILYNYTAMTENTICKLKFVVKTSAQPGASANFTFIKDSEYPNGTVESEAGTIPPSGFSFGTVSLTIPTPTPVPTKAPTPKPTNIPTPKPTKTPTPEPKTPTPDNSTQTPAVETNTPEITETPTVTEEATQTPEITESAAITPVTEDKTPAPTAKGSADDKIDTWAYTFWIVACLIFGIWIGIGLGYLIWGKRNKRNIYRYRR